MKIYFYSVRVLACFLMVCVICALSCRPKSPQQGEANKPAPAPGQTEVQVKPTPITKLDPNLTAVTVNGVKITEGQISEIIEPQMEAIFQNAPNRPPEFINQMRKMLRQQALGRMIAEQLLDAKVKQANIVVTEQEVVQQIREIAAAQRPPLSLEALEKKLQTQGKSLDWLKQQTQKGLAYQKVLEAQFAGKVNITEADAQKYYDEHPEQFTSPEQVRASHILVKVPSDASEQEKAQARAKAEDMLRQIKAGADFAELAKANSDGPSAARGGDLGFFPRGKMAAPFEKAAFALKINQVSDIVETQYGYHIIKATDRRGASTQSFERVKDDIIRRLTQRKRRQLAAEYIKSLRAQANIVYPPGKEPNAPAPAPQPVPPTK